MHGLPFKRITTVITRTVVVKVVIDLNQFLVKDDIADNMSTLNIIIG